jgi:hypothetical protein
MAGDPLAEIVDISNSHLAETGGGHNQKGIEFQKNWALVQMFALEDNETPDFLFLFEAVQDVAILDSPTAPTAIELHQVKKKDRGEWSWATLTKLHEPADATKPSKRKIKPLVDVNESPIGKLHAAVCAFKLIKSSGRFVSNAGCNVTLADGSNSATSLPSALSLLPAHFRDLLTSALMTQLAPGDPPPDLSRLLLERVDIPFDDAATYSIGKAHAFLVKRSPRHAGQAQSFVEGLLAKLGPLGAKTAVCKNFEEMKSQHGYTRSDFVAALASLEQVLDVVFYLNMWLEQLHQEGMGFMEVIAIRTAVAGIFRRQVMGSPLPEDADMVGECNSWLAAESDPSELLPFFKNAADHLKLKFPLAKKPELQAHFALAAIAKCADQS